MKRNSLFVVMLAATLVSSHAYADDTAFGGGGSSPMPIGNQDIEMVSERIVIRGNDIGDERGDGRWNVQCDFVFRNTTDKEVDLEVGFPFPVKDEMGAVSVPAGRKVKIGDPLVYDFKVEVDGKPVRAARKKISPNQEKGQYYKDAYIWRMKFAPGQSVKVHHDYVTGVTWDVMGYSWASYVIMTGGNWKGGRIGSADLEVVPNALVKLCKELEGPEADYLRPKPKGMKVVGKGADRKFVWSFRNYKPTEDLDICMQTASNYAMRKILFPIVMYGDVEEEMAKLSPERLRLMRNTVFARHGRTFKDPALQKYFDEQWWYIPNSGYRDSMLTKEDRRIVALISKEEAARRRK